MTTLRLHGTCPECGCIERLRPDGTVVQHTRPRGDYWRTGRCEGTGAAPDCGTTHHTGCACYEARRDARERELTEALRASLARWRAARGRYTPFPHCDVCGVRLAADGTETHDAECAVGRDLRVLGGGAT